MTGGVVTQHAQTRSPGLCPLHSHVPRSSMTRAGKAFVLGVLSSRPSTLKTVHKALQLAVNQVREKMTVSDEE